MAAAAAPQSGGELVSWGGARRARYRDRRHAGESLAGALRHLSSQPCTVLAVPNGGVPIGIELARALRAGIGVELVRKLQIPGNTEAGFGAVTSGGLTILNEPLVHRLGLGRREIERIVEETMAELRRREAEFGSPHAPVKGRTVVLTDDGLASGFTMVAAVRSVRARRPTRVVVAVPTAPLDSLTRVREVADEVLCPDVASGGPFAVADAYGDWYDLTTEEAAAMLRAFVERTGKH